MQELLAYLGVFVAAATPWVELVIVVPAAIAAGLNPAAVAVVALAGNAMPVVGIVLAHRQIEAWRQRRRRPHTGDDAATGSDERRGWRRRLSDRAMHRYGVPGLALVAPATTGIHLATLIALGLHAPRRLVAAWMVGSLVAWAAVTATLAAFGVGLLR